MKSIVIVSLAKDPITGQTDPTVPFLVTAQELSRNGLYCDEPAVIAQLFHGESEARFEAEWIDGEWKFGKRVADA